MRSRLLLITCLLAMAPPALARRPRPHKRPVPAAAQEANKEEADKKTRAQKAVGEGRAYFDKGDFSDAIGRFEEAYRLFPVPKMLYNLGITYDALHKDDRAVCALERFVTDLPDADPTLRADAQDRIGRLKGRIGRLEVQAPTGAVLFLDGEERATAPPKAPLCAAQGKHRVVAVTTGAAPVGLDLNVEPGALLKLSLDPATNSARLISDSVADAAAAAAAAIAAQQPPPPVAPVAGKPVWKKWWLWTVVGVVAGGVIVAGVVVGTRPTNVAAPASDFGPIAVFK